MRRRCGGAATAPGCRHSCELPAAVCQHVCRHVYRPVYQLVCRHACRHVCRNGHGDATARAQRDVTHHL